MSLIKTAIIGYGQSGEISHAYGIGKNPEFEIVAVCDLSAERRSYAHKTLGCPTYSNVEDLIDGHNDLDLAAIVTRSDTHCEVACTFLNAGVNVLVTKPWAVNEKEALKMIEAGARSEKQIFPWIPMYWSPEYDKINELIDKGSIGKVFAIRRYVTFFNKRTDWQTELKYGGGCLNNWGAHIIQPVLGLAKSPVEKLSGHLDQVLSEGDGDDVFLSIMKFENGITGIAEFAQAPSGLPSFMIQGTMGTIISDGETITLIQQDPSSTEDTQETKFKIEGKRFGDEADIYRDVAKSLTEGVPFKATIANAHYGTVISDAIRASNETSLPLNLKECETTLA